MVIPLDSFEVQSESPVDFASLKRNRMDLESLIALYIYINHTHLIHFFYTFQFVSILFVKSKISFSLKLKT